MDSLATRDPMDVIGGAIADGRGAGRDGAPRVGAGTRKRAKAVIKALDEAGFAVVPKEPSLAMVRAGDLYVPITASPYGAYVAMVEAGAIKIKMGGAQ